MGYVFVSSDKTRISDWFADINELRRQEFLNLILASAIVLQGFEKLPEEPMQVLDRSNDTTSVSGFIWKEISR